MLFESLSVFNVINHNWIDMYISGLSANLDFLFNMKKIKRVWQKKSHPLLGGSAYGNRTRVPCVRGMCPSR